MSLFHAAWSLCLWVFGYRSIQGTGKPKGRRRGKTGACRHMVHVTVPCSVVAVPVGVWIQEHTGHWQAKGQEER
jgi:hypothetical protein